jgi:hypothetical protein
MKNRLKIIKKCNDPKVLVITPLKKGDKISKDTKKSIKRNKTPFEWISLCEDNNPAMNTSIAYKKWIKDNGDVPYVLKIDNDINASRKYIDKLYQCLLNNPKFAYAYSAFEFTGAINVKFPLRKFDPVLLRKQNYISSCSLIDTTKLKKVKGFVTDNKYKGLLDWALWLKFLNFGFEGLPVDNCFFNAFSKPSSISCWPTGNYMKTREKIINDFVLNFSLDK